MQDTGAISQSDIRQFEVEVEMTSGEKRDYEYEVGDGHEKAKVELRAGNGQKSKHGGEQTPQDCRRLMERIGLSRRMSPDEAIERVCASLDASCEHVEKLDIEIRYGNGIEVEVKFK